MSKTLAQTKKCTKTWLGRAGGLAATVALATASPLLAEDYYAIGAGAWPCSKVLAVNESGTESEVGQLIGWVLGFWTAATFERGDAFADIVENVGGREIFVVTMERCREGPPDSMLAAVSRSMVLNTK